MTGILNLLAGAVGVVKDTYFNLVTLLLPGDGTNGAQNNTFLDSSTNNFTITRNGGNPGTTQGTFSPFSQTGWSTFFPSGTTDAILVNGSTNLNSTGDFTWECWGWYLGPPAAAYNGLVTMRTGANVGGAISIDNNDALYYAIAGVGYNHSSAVPRNQWFHVAMVRSGSGTNNVSCYLNGSRIGQFTSTAQLNGNNNMQIGQWEVDGTGSGYNYNGYISNVRYVTGSALYSGTTYTVPTAPLTAVSGTQVLTCQDNRWKDNSSNNYSFTITAGTPSIQAFSPFAPTAAYSASTNGGSGYFDGSGDYLTWTGSAIGTSQFSFECWFYHTGTYASIQAMLGPNSATNGGISVRIASSTQIKIDRLGVGESVFTVPTMVANTWYHLVACRGASNTTTVFLNGTRSSTGTITDSYSYGNAASISYLNSSTPFPFTGYIANARLVIGSSVYDPTQTSITIPTAPLTAITNTQLLLNFTNAGITDATAKNVLETVGGAQISTTQSKFGGSSMYFDGTGDYLYGVSNQNLILGSGDFTVEFWFYPTNVNSTNQRLVTTTTGSIGSTDLLIRLESTNTIRCIVGSTSMDPTTPTITANTWNHVALVRSGSATNNCSIYLNGSRISQGTSTSTISTAIQYIGGYYSTGSPPEYFYGYIDDLRITKGYARYSGSTYTQPTAAFPVQ